MFLIIKAPKGTIFRRSPYNGIKLGIDDKEIAVNLAAVEQITIAETTVCFGSLAIHFEEEGKAREVYENALNGSAKMEVSAGIQSVEYL